MTRMVMMSTYDIFLLGSHTSRFGHSKANFLVFNQINDKFEVGGKEN